MRGVNWANHRKPNKVATSAATMTTISPCAICGLIRMRPSSACRCVSSASGRNSLNPSAILAALIRECPRKCSCRVTYSPSWPQNHHPAQYVCVRLMNGDGRPTCQCRAADRTLFRTTRGQPHSSRFGHDAAERRSTSFDGRLQSLVAVMARRNYAVSLNVITVSVRIRFDKAPCAVTGK